MRGDGWVYRRGRKWWIGYFFQGREHRELGGRTEAEAKRKLRSTIRAIQGDRFLTPAQRRVMVGDLLDLLQAHTQNKGLRSADKLASHMKPLRTFFARFRAEEVTTASIERYTRSRLADGRARATVNRELEALRRAFILASRRTPPLIVRVPYIEPLKVENARQGFLGRAEMEAIAANLRDADLRDFVIWGFWTGMRKGEAAQLTWDMLDRESWTLRLDPKAAKTGRGRVLALEGPLRDVMDRRIAARRLECPLIFHRTSKGRRAQPIKDFRREWARACKAAGIPAGRIAGLTYHDTRRSAVRNMVRAGVDPAVAMKISGHRTRSMFDRYNIVSEDDIRAAVKKTVAFVNSLPRTRSVVPFAVSNGEPVQKADNLPLSALSPSLFDAGLVAEAGGNRTHRSGLPPGAGRL